MLTVKQGMTMLDAVIASAGSLEDWFAFCALNNLCYGANVTAGQQLAGTGNLYQASSKPDFSYLGVKPVTVLQGQSSMDMSIQQLGSLESWFALCALNGLGYSDDLGAGQALNYSLTPYSKAVLAVYQANGYKPATAVTNPGQAAPVQLAGIGYWALEGDFVVQ
jgi:hypothetical protein